MPIEPVLRSPIGFLLIPQSAVIALSSAIESLRIANRYLTRRNHYQWQLLSLDGSAVPDDNGIMIQPDASLERAAVPGALIVCADIRPERFYSAHLKHRLHAFDRAGVTLGGLDTGSFLLARAGLLKGHRVTMHWEVLDAFRERFPGIEVLPTLFEVGNRRMSCAGGTAVLDMMLSAIALEHGASVAQRREPSEAGEGDRPDRGACRHAAHGDAGGQRGGCIAAPSASAVPATAEGIAAALSSARAPGTRARHADADRPSGHAGRRSLRVRLAGAFLAQFPAPLRQAAFGDPACARNGAASDHGSRGVMSYSGK